MNRIRSKITATSARVVLPFGLILPFARAIRRVVNAATLLRNGASVTQACKAVTPEGTSHFISVFKKLVGTTPKQYAKQY